MGSLEHYQNIMKIVPEAIRFCCQKEHMTEETFFRNLQAGDEATHSRLRYALAKGISGYLGSFDDNLQSVYVYGSTMDDNAGLSSDIDLIIQVKCKNGETKRALEILDSYLLISYRILLGNDEYRMNCMLDVHIVDEQDIKERTDYGCLISSQHTIPVKVWSRA
ncbi:MAG: nucleotidyltransferase domain-containing protein [Bacillota bacterium]|nr:nucleotidyltransferase domain-containing protein [Bacillota bacterium]MDW7684196.1 nucleotidyltransferase domain-containing protein [Bacillota bacterium]